MFDVRDLSNTAIVLLLIAVFVSVFAVQALVVTVTQPAQLTRAIASKRVDELAVDPGMAFYLLPQDLRVSVGDTFVVTVAVGNVTDMYGWQAFLRFDPTVLEAVRVSFPANRVFSSSVTVSSALASYDQTEFSGDPLQRVRNDEGWVLAGDCLLGVNQPTFHGSGVLCQVEFKAISPGSTAIRLLHGSADDFQTFNLTFDLKTITTSSPSNSTIIAVPH